MLSKKSIAILSAVFLSILCVTAGCVLFPSTSDFDMPSGVGMTVPSSMKMKAAVPPFFNEMNVITTTNNGPGYKTMKLYVQVAVNVSDVIDILLSTIVGYSNTFKVMIGNRIDADGKWFKLGQYPNSSKYYLYVGFGSIETNIFIDWEKVNGKFRGTVAYFVPATNTTLGIDSAVAYYDKTADRPYIDITIKPRNTAILGLVKSRVKVEQLSSTEVNVYMKTITTNAGNNTLTNWDMLGYGSMSGDGGVMAYGTGYYTNLSIFTINSTVKYSYEEYFDYTGNTIWSKGMVTFKPAISATNYIIDDPDTSTLYTTNSKPAVTNQVNNVVTTGPLTNCDMPAVTLP